MRTSAYSAPVWPLVLRTLRWAGTWVPPVLATVLAAITWATMIGVPPFTFPTGAPLSASYAGGVLVALVIIVTWLVRDAHQRASLAMVASAWLATSLQGLVGLAPLLAQLAAAAGPLALMGLGYQLAQGLRRWVGGLAAMAMVAHVLGYQPFADPACVAPCPEVDAPIADAWGARSGLAGALVLELAAYLVLIVGTFRTSISLAERTVILIVATCFGAADLIPWVRWGRLETSDAPDVLRTIGVVLATGYAAFIMIRMRRARLNLQGLVRLLSDDRDVPFEGVRSVQFAVPGSSVWIDADGTESESAAGTTVPGPDGRAAVRLVAARSSNLADGLTPVSLLTLDNRRLAAVAKWRLAQLRASQARIVATSERERHRIDRDLHDGAQQQLVAAAMHLTATRERLDASATESLDRAAALIHEALTELRTFTHRSLLTVLSTEGLAAAIEDLAESSVAIVDVDLGGRASLAASVERAAYDLVAFGLRTGAARSARVRCDDGMLRVDLVVAGTVQDLATVADRIGATGGELTTTPDPHDSGLTRTTARWPCVW